MTRHWRYTPSWVCLHYVVYNPVFWQQDGHQPLEVYKLTAGGYERQAAEPYWMSEVGLGIGRYRGDIGGIQQEILTWYDAEGKRHLSVADKEREKREKLEAFLRSQGFDPDNLPN